MNFNMMYNVHKYKCNATVAIIFILFKKNF